MKFYWLLVLSVIFFSCEKTITLDVENQPPKLVVEASIESNSTPVVSLSSSLNYFSSITTEELTASFIHGAAVTVSDGIITSLLKEYTVSDLRVAKILMAIDPDAGIETGQDHLEAGHLVHILMLKIMGHHPQTLPDVPHIPLLFAEQPDARRVIRDRMNFARQQLQQGRFA